MARFFIIAPAGAQEIAAMAKPNYQFEKRARELAKKKKQEEKRLRKLQEKAARTTGGTNAAPAQPATDSSRPA